MAALLIVFGIALAVGGAVAGVVRLVIGRVLAEQGRLATAIALVAGAAAFATWVVFAFDWMAYSLSENGPSYYAFSDYVEYRRAVEGLSGVAIGLGYALLTGALVAGAGLLTQRVDSWWLLPAGLAAAGSIVLPAIVPAALPRAEYGKDPVFYLSRGGPYETPPGIGRPTVCFAYGIERPNGPEPPGKSDPEVCLQLRRNPTAHRLVTDPSPASREGLSVYDLADELNESSIRPDDPVGGLSIDGVEIARVDWTGVGSAPAVPPITLPPGFEPPAGDEEIKAKVLRLATHMENCRRTQGGYVPCAKSDMLLQAGVPLKAMSVESVSRNGYTIVGSSATGNTFTLSHHRPRPPQRTCTRGTEGCLDANARW